MVAMNLRKGDYTQAGTAVLDYVFSNLWGKLRADGAATLSGTFAFSVSAGNPTAWAEILTAQLFTDPVPSAPTRYALSQTATALSVRRP